MPTVRENLIEDLAREILTAHEVRFRLLRLVFSDAAEIALAASQRAQENFEQFIREEEDGKGPL